MTQSNHDLIRQQARTIARQQQRIAELEARVRALESAMESLDAPLLFQPISKRKLQLKVVELNHATE